MKFVTTSDFPRSRSACELCACNAQAVAADENEQDFRKRQLRRPESQQSLRDPQAGRIEEARDLGQSPRGACEGQASGTLLVRWVA